METEDAEEIRAYDGTVLYASVSADPAEDVVVPGDWCAPSGTVYGAISFTEDLSAPLPPQPDDPAEITIHTPRGPYLVMGTVSQIERIKALSPKKQLKFVLELERIRNG